MKIHNSSRLSTPLLLIALLPLVGCGLFKGDNDHILFIDYNKVGVSTSGVASAAYEPLLNVGWTGAKLAIVPATESTESRTPSLFATFQGDLGSKNVSLGNTMATGSAADKIADKFSVMNVSVRGDKDAVKAVSDSQSAVAASAYSTGMANARVKEAEQKTAEANAREQEAERDKVRYEAGTQFAQLGKQFIDANNKATAAQEKLGAALTVPNGPSTADSLKAIADAVKKPNK